jgi:hypothetical protein
MLFRLAGSLFCGIPWISPLLAADAASIRAVFADPPRRFSSGPLWVWNDMLTEEQVLGSLRDLAAQKVKQAFVHPRPGLMTPYLSADWFRLWKAALAEAQRLDMNLWIYDENSYPSGFAGGLVPEAMPESRGRSLAARQVRHMGRLDDAVLAVFRIDGDRCEDVTLAARSGPALPDAQYLVTSVVRSAPAPWHGGKTYVDLIYPGVTQKFLQITLDAYQREVGSQFGLRVPGSFTDEPNLVHNGVPWTDDLPQVFQKRWGYDLRPHLASLFRELGDWRRVRHNFYQVLSDLFIERWSKPYHDYCQKHHLEWTGHYWDHAWPSCMGVPDNMAMYAWHQRPAIDCLMNQYREDVNAQFGNARMVRELSSVANQLGMPRTLCEAYGAGGWDLRFEDMKRIGDWLYVLGVNTLDQHLSYVTIRGARKRDHPQSFSYHEPWWNDYHVLAQYFTRLSYALSQGHQVNHVLVLEPTTTAWMYQNGSDAKTREHLKAIGDKFQELIMELEREQVEYDIGSEDIISRYGSVDASKDRWGSSFFVGQRHYEIVVLPPLIENLNRKTAELLKRFVEHHGALYSPGAELSRTDGQATGKVALGDDDARITPEVVGRLDAAIRPDPFWITRPGNDPGKLFHHRRQFGDGQLVFLVNTSIESPSSGTVSAAGRGVEQWDPESGAVRPYPFQSPAESDHLRVTLTYHLPPCGSLLLFLSNQPLPPGKEPSSTWAAITPKGQMKTHRDEPNVLTLDYCDLTAGGRTKKNIYCYQAGLLAFQAAGMERNPWDSAVQFRDELIRHKFPPDSSLSATYRFTIEKALPKALSIVVERPDLYSVTCNGKPCAARPGQWWLDKAFGRIDLAASARVGENELTIHAAPMTIYHEIEPVYLLGDFSLRPAAAGFVVAPGRALGVGPEGWNAQGHPFYAAGVTYSQDFEVPEPRGRYRVLLPKWYGSVARVTVNGQPAGHVLHQPWECDVTGAIRPGANRIDVVVVGTLKNTLGPHHGKPPLGAAWPASFHKAPPSGPPPGNDYDTVAYGLFEPFVLQQGRDRP